MAAAAHDKGGTETALIHCSGREAFTHVPKSGRLHVVLMAGNILVIVHRSLIARVLCQGTEVNESGLAHMQIID